MNLCGIWDKESDLYLGFIIALSPTNCLNELNSLP